ncbi:Mim1 protein [Candida orthopsilosis Co 90-125]|uniref:Mim1 protein n=1 Tax=Candida orthopsilosis (strain 90-125) TaxID=1136231 RepID=H8X5H8_CANO9|nr:Mim1 protein [Candida orthopsilosis Co 90-125]CCG23434.1 Mim1 protein [Candida orthopsilosis Co 90-125]
MSSSFAQHRQTSGNTNRNQQAPSASIPRNSEEVGNDTQTIFRPENFNAIEEVVIGEIVADALSEGINHDATAYPIRQGSDEAAENADIADMEMYVEEKEIFDDNGTVEDDEGRYLEQRNLSFWSHFVGIVRKSAINLVLPFINGMMLGFGEILAHEIGFHYHWHGAKVEPPRRLAQRRLEESGSKYL